MNTEQPTIKHQEHKSDIKDISIVYSAIVLVIMMLLAALYCGVIAYFITAGVKLALI